MMRTSDLPRALCRVSGTSLGGCQMPLCLSKKKKRTSDLSGTTGNVSGSAHEIAEGQSLAETYCEKSTDF